MKIVLLVFLFAGVFFQSKAQLEMDSCAYFIQQGDNFMAQKQFLKAKNMFERACLVDSEKCPKQKIKQVSESMRSTDGCGYSQVPKIIARADECFNCGLYEKALEYYKRAQILKANDPYTKERIEAINKILAEKEK